MEVTRADVAKKLIERKASQPCNRCGHAQFSLLEEFSNIMIQKDLKGLVIGGPSVPVAVVVCNNCGAITFHALGALGLLGGNNA